MISAFSTFGQARYVAAAPNVWVAVTIPQQAKNPAIGCEGTGSNFRVSASDALNPATEGLFLTAGSMYEIEGQAAENVIIQISVSVATVIIVQWTN
jgi:hypothetical protein